MNADRLSLKMLAEQILREQEIQEFGWQDVKRGAKKFATGAALAGTLAGATPAFAAAGDYQHGKQPAVTHQHKVTPSDMKGGFDKFNDFLNQLSMKNIDFKKGALKSMGLLANNKVGGVALHGQSIDGKDWIVTWNKTTNMWNASPTEKSPHKNLLNVSLADRD